jgi:predicted  nucleic acid-binding Zn-ribbon protein
MSTLSQSIPNLLLGISQQPDSRKRPGQVKNAVNAFPDFALGMLKRPGGKFVAKLHKAPTTGKWFPILRDSDEKYIACYEDNRFQVWDLLDGEVRMVDMGSNTGVQSGCTPADLKTEGDDLNTAVATTATELGDMQTTESTLAKALAGQTSTVSRLLEFSYDYSAGYVKESLKSGIIKDAGGEYLVKNNDTIVASQTTTLPANYALGTERTDEHPLLAAQGYRVFEAQLTTAATHTEQNLTDAEDAYDNTINSVVTDGTLQEYNTATTAEGTARTDYNTEFDACAITDAQVPNDAYLKDATADDIELLTLNDFTFVLNKKKEAKMKTATTHGSIATHRAFVVISIVANGHYDINLTGFSGTAATYNANSGDDGEHIAADLAGDINGNNGYTAEAIGPGLYITRTSAFTITTSGPGSSNSIYALTDSVENISKLPAQCKDGYVCKVINSTSVDIDDMYVIFEGSNGDGTGYWEETTAPGITYEFDELTMPHQLVRQADGSFLYGPVNWNDRIVGDNTTNPIPSFIDNTISHIFFYRNRMGFLSGQNVILGKAGDLFNFWNTSAQVATDDDPIDISAAGKKPVFLNYVEPTSVGLVMYSTTEQFLLTTDSDILSPKTSKVNTLSSYEADAAVESVALGTSQAFINKTPLYTRLFEINEINSEQPPLLSDVTSVIPELIPETINSMVASPALSIVSLGTTGSSNIFQYRFLEKTREERAVNSWYKWELTGTLLTQFFDSSTYYVVVKNDNDVYVQSFDMTQSSEEGFLTLPTGEKTDVCLDLFNINPHRTYTASTNKTRIFLPYDSVTGKELNVVVLGGYIGDAATVSSQSVGAVLKPTIAGSAGSQHVDIDGDFRGRDLIIGYNYIMTVSLPKLYRYSISGGNVSNDDVSSLIIHRLKVKTGLSGPVDYKVSITGINDWTNTISVTQPNQYQLNNVNMQASSTHVVPIFQRNENLAIDIIGNTPFPVSLLGLDWEGKLNQRFYRRG